MIRDAVPADVPALVLLGSQMHAESNYACLTYAPEKVTAHFAALIDNPDGLFKVAERGGEIIGFVTASIGAPYFSEERIASEQLVYMTPEHRGGITAVRLLLEFVSWAKVREVRLITAGITTGVTMTQSAALYHRIGFNLMGYVFKWSDT